MEALRPPDVPTDLAAGPDANTDQPIYRLDDYVKVWLDHARAGRAIGAIREARIAMLKSELCSLRRMLEEPRS